MNFAHPARQNRFARPPGTDGEVVPFDLGSFLERRQQFVDALPLPTAILCEDQEGCGFIECANALFEAFTGETDPLQPLDRLAIFEDCDIRSRLNAFAASQEQVCEAELIVERDGVISYQLVKLSKLAETPLRPRRMVLSMIDRTQQVETERDLRTQMLRDSLTGLLKRQAFTEALAELLETPGGFAPHAVVVIDVTRFSRINESVGAAAGDALLTAFAQRLIDLLGPGDVVARIGGDEFGVLLPAAAGLDDVLAFAARVREALTEPFNLCDLDIRVDCAFGAALLAQGEIAEEMLRNAQFALRRAKATGALQLYRPDEAQAARRRFTMETELRRAIEADQLELHFQPLVDLATGRVTGFEALARWEHAEWGHVPACDFIAVAEESGLIMPLGRWALDRALATLAAWDRKMGRTLPIYVAVNLSAIQIQRDDVPAIVADALARHGIAGKRLLLELTESAIIQDPEAASAVLHAMREIDVRIALDDFGTGYTSLAYLQRLPIDMLKMDGRFVTGMLDDPDATAIVRAILSLAGSMRMVTTAEGIENEELARTLRALGCTKGQGFHFAPPLWPDAALSYFVSRSA